MALSLPQPCLCLVTGRRVGDGRTLVERIAEAVAGGVDMVQIREKDLPGGELLELAQAAKGAIAGRALLIVNERVDVALAVGADGVQLGEAALPPAAARKVMGPEALIGRSIHSVEGALQARADGAHFVVVGSMYPTLSHPQDAPAGPGLMRSVAGLPDLQAPPLPLIGIGGITAANLGEVIQAGAWGVAVITSILASPDPMGEARRLKQAMLEAWEDQTPPVSRLVSPSVSDEAGGGSAAR